MDKLQVLSHLVGKVLKAEYIDDPFGHFYVDRDFLPPAIYPELVAALPYLTRFYQPLSATNYIREDGTPTREQVCLNGFMDQNLLHSALDRVLRPLYEALADMAFKEAVFTKLAPELARRFKCTQAEAVKVHADRDIRVFKDTIDYEIVPHRDTHYKRVTLQFYLPKDGKSSNMGTALYTEKKVDHEVTSIWERFDEVKRFPFQPNTGYAFVVCKGERNSWHGRRKLTDLGVERNTLMVIFEDRREVAVHPG